MLYSSRSKEKEECEMFNMLYTLVSNQTVHRALAEDAGAPELRDRYAFMMTAGSRQEEKDFARFELEPEAKDDRRCA